MSQVMSKNEFLKSFIALAHACKFNIDDTLTGTYYAELNHIPVQNLAEAMKYFTLQNKWPSVIDLQKRCNAVVTYKQPETKWAASASAVNEQVKTFDSWLHGVRKSYDPSKDFQQYSELGYMLRLDYPCFSDLKQTIEYWKECIKKIRAAGWYVNAWDEYDGKTKVRQSHGGKESEVECRVYYARLIVSKTKITEPPVKNHFETNGVVYCYPEIMHANF